jgi:hypothetical protein
MLNASMCVYITSTSASTVSGIKEDITARALQLAEVLLY